MWVYIRLQGELKFTPRFGVRHKSFSSNEQFLENPLKKDFINLKLYSFEIIAEGKVFLS